MITLFTTAKPFLGQTEIAQVNALTSWKHLHPDVEIILFGQAQGAEEIAARLGLAHIPDVATNELGTPLISAMFEGAQAIGRHDLQAYVNCDIILLDDFVPAVSRVSLSRFLIAGQRWDLDLDEALDFGGNWRATVRQRTHEGGALHPPAGSDYFVYPRGTFNEIPPFAVGRAGWDNWIIYYCLSKRIPVIDASRSVTVVHQNHPCARRFIHGEAVGPENKHNAELAPTARRITLTHANWLLLSQGLRNKRSLRHRIRSAVILPLVNPRRYAWFRPVAWFLRKVLSNVDGRLNGPKWLPEE